MSPALAAGTLPPDPLAWGLATSPYAVAALALFVIAYVFVIAEEFTALRKSKPVILAAGALWILVALAWGTTGHPEVPTALLRANLLEYAELLLFLIAAITYVNSMDERGVFMALKSGMIARGYTLRQAFWLTGLSAFFISPMADNLTTALVMGSVVLAIGAGHPRFLVAGCINIVVAANAGGAFSPFGDITTLMAWQRGVLRFEEFFALFVPSLVNWLIPAAILSSTLPHARPSVTETAAGVKPGGLIIVGLFATTLTLTVVLHHFLHLPPALGMMTGLGLLKIHGYFIRKRELRDSRPEPDPAVDDHLLRGRYKPATRPFDIFISMKRMEWDTLLFFYGVVLCVGALGALGQLAWLSGWLYHDLGATQANILVGLLSAVVDNIPIMYAVLTMNPDMSTGQWLLVTLTAGVGGSLLSIGSAAGVALMGQARGVYTFFAHLRWAWAVALGYAGSIVTHFIVNRALF